MVLGVPTGPFERAQDTRVSASASFLLHEVRSPLLATAKSFRRLNLLLFLLPRVKIPNNLTGVK